MHPERGSSAPTRSEHPFPGKPGLACVALVGAAAEYARPG
jgi:hypothetical protein